MRWETKDSIFVVIVVCAMICSFQLGMWASPTQCQMPTSEFNRQSIRMVDISNMSGGDLNNTRARMTDVRTLNTIYHSTHVYREGVFDCKFMAMDVWNMVESRGIRARIVVGDTDTRVNRVENASHAWVIAEVRPGEWVAVESTGGYLVCDDGMENICEKTNPLYYEGWVYDNPTEYMRRVRWY